MKKIVQFHISQGDKYYVAEGIDIPIVTQGKTLDELAQNIREATELFFEGENFEEMGFAKHPSVLVNLELPELTYA